MASIDDMALHSCSLRVGCEAVLTTPEHYCGDLAKPYHHCFGPSLDRRRRLQLTNHWDDDNVTATVYAGRDDDGTMDDDDDDALVDDGGWPGVVAEAVDGLYGWYHDDCEGGDSCYAFDSPRECVDHRFADDGSSDDCERGKSAKDLADLMARVAVVVLLVPSVPSLGLAYFSKQKQLGGLVQVAIAPAVGEARPLPVAVAVPEGKYRA